MSKRPDETSSNACPRRIFDNLLFHASAKGQDLQAIALTPDQPTENEAPGGTRQYDIAVEQIRKAIRRNPVAPDFVTDAVFANACLNDDRNRPGIGRWR